MSDAGRHDDLLGEGPHDGRAEHPVTEFDAVGALAELDHRTGVLAAQR